MARQVPSALSCGKSLLMPRQIHQVGRVFAVVDGEGRIKPYPFGIFSQKTVAPVDTSASLKSDGLFPQDSGKTRDLSAISAAACREKAIRRIWPVSAPLIVRCATR